MTSGIKNDHKEFIRLSKIAHSNKYRYHKTVYTRAKDKIIITCPIHGDFVQLAQSHILGFGCKFCGGIKVADKTRKSAEYYIDKANKAHNYKFDYSKTNWKEHKINVICPKHGIFNCNKRNHLRGHDCMRCRGGQVSFPEFLRRAQEVHGDTYIYDSVDKDNFRYGDHITIICKVHGPFSQVPSSHITGRGCMECGHISTRLTPEEFFTDCAITHGNKYNYSKSKFIGLFKEVKIICPEHGEFLQVAENHKKGHGCRICSEPQGEKRIRVILQNNNIKHSQQYEYNDCKYKRVLPFDFYLPEYNMLIEFHGRQHYEETNYFKTPLKEQRRKDRIKLKYCKNNNIPLLIIPHWDYDKIEELINNFIELVSKNYREANSSPGFLLGSSGLSPGVIGCTPFGGTFTPPD
jgi:hypothetical protein